jgi:hypothetical protein
MGAQNIALQDFTITSGFDEAAIERTVRRFGVAVLPRFVPPPVLEELRSEFETALQDDDERYVYRLNYAAGRAVSLKCNENFADRNPAMARFFNDPALVSLARRYVGTPCFANYEIYATHEFKSQVTVAPKHFDKLWTLKFMVYLSDVGPTNAPFGVVPGSMRANRETFRRIFDDSGIDKLAMSDDRYQNMANSAADGANDVVPILAPAGTLIVFDTDTYHFAPAVAPGCERRILRGHCGPATAYSSVTKHSRQWWRGEKAYARLDALKDRVLDWA